MLFLPSFLPSLAPFILPLLSRPPPLPPPHRDRSPPGVRGTPTDRPTDRPTHVTCVNLARAADFYNAIIEFPLSLFFPHSPSRPRPSTAGCPCGSELSSISAKTHREKGEGVMGTSGQNIEVCRWRVRLPLQAPGPSVVVVVVADGTFIKKQGGSRGAAGGRPHKRMQRFVRSEREGEVGRLLPPSPRPSALLRSPEPLKP